MVGEIQDLSRFARSLAAETDNTENLGLANGRHPRRPATIPTVVAAAVRIVRLAFPRRCDGGGWTRLRGELSCWSPVVALSPPAGSLEFSPWPASSFMSDRQSSNSSAAMIFIADTKSGAVSLQPDSCRCTFKQQRYRSTVVGAWPSSAKYGFYSAIYTNIVAVTVTICLRTTVHEYSKQKCRQPKSGAYDRYRGHLSMSSAAVDIVEWFENSSPHTRRHAWVPSENSRHIVVECVAQQ